MRGSSSHSSSLAPREIAGHQAIVIEPAGADWLYVFAHGAGAGMSHAAMSVFAEALARRGVATLRYNFPYMANGRKLPDRAAVCEASVRAVCAEAAMQFAHLRLCAGGKSMGGRMTSQALANGGLPNVDVLIFLGFPLHPAGKPSVERATHLAQASVPMLFVQGDHDELAPLHLLRPVLAELERAQLHVVSGADHGLLPRSKRVEASVARADEIALTIRTFLDRQPRLEK